MKETASSRWIYRCPCCRHDQEIPFKSLPSRLISKARDNWRVCFHRQDGARRLLHKKPQNHQVLAACAISGIQCKVNKLADHDIKLNEQSMSQNQEYIRTIKRMAGDEPHVNVEIDTSYNNRPQAGFEAGTQSFCPVISQDKRKKLAEERTILLSKLGSAMQYLLY